MDARITTSHHGRTARQQAPTAKKTLPQLTVRLGEKGGMSSTSAHELEKGLFANARWPHDESDESLELCTDSRLASHLKHHLHDASYCSRDGVAAPNDRKSA